MSIQNNMEERLWDYLDGRSSAEERSVIDQLLQTNAAWKAKYAELLDINSYLQSSELEEPSMRFSKNVMEEISRIHIAPATQTYINKKIIWSICFFFIAMIIGFLVYGFGQMDWNTGDSYTVSDNLRKIDFNKFFSNTYINAFMMVNVVLGLFLLDRYLTNKRKKMMEEA